MPDSKQSIKELQERYKTLHDRKIHAEADLKNARNRLNELKDQAKKRYGTDDVDKLREKLEEMKSENERKRREYQESLDKIEAELKQVDEDYAAAARETADKGDAE